MMERNVNIEVRPEHMDVSKKAFLRCEGSFKAIMEEETKR